MHTLKKLRLLSVPLLTLSLIACGDERVQIALPPVERAEPVPFPAVPEGEAEGGRLSDKQNAELLDQLAGALDQANNRLLWLRDWLTEAQED